MHNNIICRLCAGTENLINIKYKNRGHGLLPYEIANLLLGTQIEPGDGLPSFFCTICYDTLKSFYEFKIKCMKALEKLRVSSQEIKDEIDIVEEFNSNEYTNDEIENENHEGQTENKECFKIGDELSNHMINKNFEKKERTKDLRNKEKRDDCSVPDFQCHICGSTLKSKGSLRNHLSTHSGVKKYSCSICSKRFTRLSQQKLHYNSHMGIKPCICDLCDKGFTKKMDLVRHLTVHSNERKHNCPLCNKQFKRTSGVRVHMTVHTGVRKYSCKLCDKSYKGQNGLLKHTRLHHPTSS